MALDNDANCAARAEAHHGAARGASSALMITMGTGIGGAVLLDGVVLRGANGMAGEFGHMQVVPDGRLEDRLDQRVLDVAGHHAATRCRAQRGPADGPVDVDDPGQHLGAADVNADHDLSLIHI